MTPQHDGNDIHSSWLLKEVVVANARTPQRSWLFECNDWLSKEHGLYKTRIQLTPKREILKYAHTEYKIIVLTGDKHGASTDANVYVEYFFDLSKHLFFVHLPVYMASFKN